MSIRFATIACILISTLPLLSHAQVSKKSKPFVLGTVEELYSTVLGENRILNIYLPEGYSATDTIKYPVVYLLDGGADEDFIHIVGLYQFNSFSWINRVPKSIIVGIANTDRKRDLTYASKIAEELKRYPTAGHSDKFITFIAKELQPYINKTYKTNAHKTIIGESLGGLLATEILFTKPQLFNEYIIISPSLWWDDGSLLKQPASDMEANRNNISVYVAAGKEGLAPSTISHVMEIDANLLVEKINNKKVRVFYDYLPMEDHATIAHQAVFNALRILHPVQAK
ncbi:MAG: alpha/beta hydrolase-fold protein [Ferruginibacter sp.]